MAVVEMPRGCRRRNRSKRERQRVYYRAMNIEENAVALLLRSPRLDVGTIMDVLDLGDREFREMMLRNPRIHELLDARREGTLPSIQVEPKQCLACSEWFIPYASERYCSDPCKAAGKIQNA